MANRIQNMTPAQAAQYLIEKYGTTAAITAYRRGTDAARASTREFYESVHSEIRRLESEPGFIEADAARAEIEAAADGTGKAKASALRAACSEPEPNALTDQRRYYLRRY